MHKLSKLFPVLFVLVMIFILTSPVWAYPTTASTKGGQAEPGPLVIGDPPPNQITAAASAFEISPASLSEPSSLPAEPAMGRSNPESEPNDASAGQLIDRHTYIIQLTEPGLVFYRGGLAGLPATNPAARGEKKLRANAAAGQAYLAYLSQQRQTAISDLNRALSRKVEIPYQYQAAFNGFAAELTPAEAAIVAQLPGVRYLERSLPQELHTDAGPTWIGAVAYVRPSGWMIVSVRSGSSSSAQPASWTR